MKNEVKNIQTTGYNGARTVFNDYVYVSAKSAISLKILAHCAVFQRYRSMEKQSRKFGKSISVFLSFLSIYNVHSMYSVFKEIAYYSKILFYSKLSTTKASAYYIFNTFSPLFTVIRLSMP